MLNQSPLVCICIPTYNAELTIKETLQSIVQQSYQNLVIQISDNASTDKTIQLIKAFSDPRIAIHNHDINVGGEGNFNRCITLATGQYTAIFHSDDVYHPDMISKQVEFLEKNPDVSAVFTQAVTINEQGQSLGVLGIVPGENTDISYFNFTELLKKTLLHHNFLVCPSVMVRTEIYRNQIKEWRSGLFRSSSDVDVWLRLAAINKIAILNQQLMSYRISSVQFSDAIRKRTERTDFFLVMDYYLSKPEVLKLISKLDLMHYGWLERHDRVARAFNHFLIGNNLESKRLLKDLFCVDAVHAAAVTKRGFVTLSGGMLLSMMLIFGSSRIGDYIIKTIKKISWK